MFFFTLIKKLIGTRRQEIPLNLLSRLWIEKEMSGKSSLNTPITRQWVHNDITQFYARYITPKMTALGPAVPVINHLLTLLDNAGNCLACKDIFDATAGITNVTLREHSLNVSRIAVDMIKKAHRDYDKILGKILIICLGHGIGILSSTNTIGGVVAKTLLMIDPLIHDLPYKQDIITAILTACEGNPKTDGAKILKSVFFAAKQQETERSKVLSEISRPNIPDIQKIRAAIQTPQEK